MARYVDALCAELASSELAGGALADTVFIGGGTPSLLGPELLARLLEAIPRRPGAEVTVECNPESTSDELIAAMCDAGVTRVSLGVQSLDRSVLASLGREHSPEVALDAALRVAKSDILSYNLDLIYGAAGETMAQWQQSVQAILELERPPEHISAYALTVEAGTPLQRDRSRHPDDDTQALEYEWLDDALVAHGYQWYEISNFAKPGHECWHNIVYWRQGNYIGLGCAAHSHRDGTRSANVRSVDRYLERIDAHLPVKAFEERLDGPTRRFEALELALRTRAGVPKTAFQDLGELDGLLEPNGEQLVLTRRGRLLANEVALALSASAEMAPRPGT